MKRNQKKIFENSKLLVRFIKQICNTHDTPSLIQLVAKEINYLVLCSAIVEISQNRETKFYKSLKEQCHKQGIDVYTIQERLKPVALSLGLLSSKEMQADYYYILGITPKADESEIKKAYRELARKTHPDSNRRGSNTMTFVELSEAYQTLIDPHSRQLYDQSRYRLGRWKEQADKRNNKRATSHIYQIVGLLLFLVFAAYISNLIFREKAIFDDPYTELNGDMNVSEDTKSHSNDEPTIQNTTERMATNSVEEQFTIMAINTKGMPHSYNKKGGSLIAHVNTPEVQHEIKRTTVSTEESKNDKDAMKKIPVMPHLGETIFPLKGYEENNVHPKSLSSEGRNNYPSANDSFEVVYPKSKHLEERHSNESDKNISDTIYEASSSLKNPVFNNYLSKKEQPGVSKTRQYEHTEMRKDNMSMKESKKRLESFLHTYCKIYEEKDLAKFIEFFAPDAVEKGKPFQRLLPRYKRNFETIDSIRYHIELEQYTYHVNSGIIKIQGNFLLLWRKSGGLWENSTGEISMSLTENHDSFLIKELDYSFIK